MEKASKNQAIIDAIGEPIKKGPWYNASLAVTHQRHSVSCTFPVSGPHGNGVLQLKAVRNGGLCLIVLFPAFHILCFIPITCSAQLFIWLIKDNFTNAFEIEFFFLLRGGKKEIFRTKLLLSYIYFLCH